MSWVLIATLIMLAGCGSSVAVKPKPVGGAQQTAIACRRVDSITATRTGTQAISWIQGDTLDALSTEVANSSNGTLHSELARFHALASKAEDDPQQLLRAINELSLMARTCEQLGYSRTTG